MLCQRRFRFTSGDSHDPLPDRHCRGLQKVPGVFGLPVEACDRRSTEEARAARRGVKEGQQQALSLPSKGRYGFALNRREPTVHPELVEGLR
jgi:hypothetical protein